MSKNSTILIVDDEPLGRAVLEGLLFREGYNLIFAENGAETLAKAAEFLPDLILLDVMMPTMDGFEVCGRLRADPVLAKVPVVMVTALDDKKARLRGIEAGADDFLTKPINKLELKARVKTIIKLNRYHQLLIDQAQLERAHVDLTESYDKTIEGWSRALELRDKETEGHTQRVTEMTMRLAQAMRLSEAELIHIRRGALLHDIGKMGVPDSVLLKPGPLTDTEWKIMRQHPVYAYEMLSPIPYLQPALDIPYCHHEKWDGSGYPRGLKGEKIPLAARIFSVVDVWDALRSDRPYRAAWPEDKVLAHIQQDAGFHFDPQVTQVFLGMKNEE